MSINFIAFSQENETGKIAMKWRMIGPHRGGRTVGAVGVSQQPFVFYIGVNNGGVWKTNDAGRTWKPIFDEQSTGSIGDVAVAPSNPEVVYVASGEGLHRPDLSVGNGMYRSSNGGQTWEHIGFENAQQIAGISIDPKNENRLFIAVLGHPYGANPERGIYKSSDGGKTWEKSLYINENVGATQVLIDPSNNNTIYADMWENRHGPWENGEWSGKESGLFKSLDGGATWKKLTTGLPTTDQGLGRIGFCIAPSDPQRLYATVDAGNLGGIYRSDNGGESWKRMNADERYWGRGSDFAEVKADPKNADIVYTAGVVVWKSVDGGTTFSAFKGAPGGDDYHRIWINPSDSKILLIASDQGAVVTLNGGQTFSSWYNQPSAQFYHVSVDNSFPYNVLGGQQESGSVSIASRSNDGRITFHDWHPVGAEEYGYVEADPLNPDIIYGGKLTRFNKKTGQIQNISPDIARRGVSYRFIRTAPLVFSPVDHKTLYYAGNVLFKTLNGGESWQVISPDLSRESWDIPASMGIYRTDNIKTMPRRGVIYTIAPSPKDINTIWCGTDDGLIHLTKDGGKTWKNVTPPSISSWSKISILEASHFDIHSCYAAVNRIRLDDMHPHIFKTNDDGKTWKEIVDGLPVDPVNSIKEDPQTKGLLFASTETAVHVSFNDGKSWQSLRLNMPATSVRDLVIKNNDLVIGTHGRSFWILDDIASLRQLAKNNTANATLFSPSEAYRVRWNMWSDTPLPPDEPAGQNPPDGAILDYYLPNTASNVSIEIRDSKNKLIRRFNNHDTLYKIPDVNIPLYWVRPQQILSAEKGAHRFVWDLHYQPLNVPPAYSISATPYNTTPDYTSPWVLPGNYNVTLISDGNKTTKTISIKMDPRVKTTSADINKQFTVSISAYENIIKIDSVINEADLLKIKLGKINKNQDGSMVSDLNKLINGATGAKTASFSSLRNTFNNVLGRMQESDFPPTSQTINTFDSANKDLQNLWTEWVQLKNKITIANGS
ncbi:MAG: hypothetical protein NVS3B19_02130 [Ginsengibacter sp.]